MNTQLLNKVETVFKTDVKADFNVGDTITVHNVIREGEKSRIQLFKGVVIARKGSGTRATFTVRKISEGVGVEKVFPLYSPNVKKIDVIREGNVRRAKLYYLRDRVGKSALKVRGVDVKVLAGTSMKEETAELAAEEEVITSAA